MSEPLRFPDNLIVYVVLGAPAFVLFIFHEWTQNLLSRMAALTATKGKAQRPS
jgi:hypothetical protein